MKNKDFASSYLFVEKKTHIPVWNMKIVLYIELCVLQETKGSNIGKLEGKKTENEGENMKLDFFLLSQINQIDCLIIFTYFSLFLCYIFVLSLGVKLLKNICMYVCWCNIFV